MKKSYANVTFYKNYLIVDYNTTESDDNISTPFDTESFGYVVSDVGYISISKEAHWMLTKLKRGSDSIGEIDIFATSDGNYAFATIGQDKVLLDLDNSETSRQFVIPPIGKFQIIENEPPEGAMEAIDRMDS